MSQLTVLKWGLVFGAALALFLLLWATKKASKTEGLGMPVVAAYWSGLLSIALMVWAAKILAPQSLQCENPNVKLRGDALAESLSNDRLGDWK
jgi:HAMP domain-containing protein